MNPNSRLEAFCDGVFAIALTLLIIDIKLPPADTMTSTADVWRALTHVAPAISAFFLSFAVILITWVNHHAALVRVARSSPQFIYANGFLLLAVVLVPFPTSLMGEHLLTDHAAPAVVLYNAVLALTAVGWILLTSAALRGGLAKDAASASSLRENRRYGCFAFALYTLCAVAAVWFPLAIAIVTGMTWIFWLVLGISMKHER